MEWQFFEIGFKSLNLFSMILGMIFAFFNQGLFGKNIGKWIIFYFAGLALWYGVHYYVEKDLKMKYSQTQEFITIQPNGQVTK